jgi:hypothetical protein
MAGFYATVSWWVPIFLFTTHWFADKYKIHLIEKENLKDENNPYVSSRLKFLFHADKVWHLVQLAVVVIFGVLV